ncbi:hypothetical protein [Microbacterium sp. 77mftsu3.1]|uniref:hypothetical protein n=1 Tax=Microbacterium sp. 77mftsu3.1 TaxID=1761802 RepID=UPI00115FFC26|nr:hypothetical protein [Microbacterium sp. 77mftsu3.1]
MRTPISSKVIAVAITAGLAFGLAPAGGAAFAATAPSPATSSSDGTALDAAISALNGALNSWREQVTRSTGKVSISPWSSVIDAAKAELTSPTSQAALVQHRDKVYSAAAALKNAIDVHDARAAVTKTYAAWDKAAASAKGKVTITGWAANVAAAKKLAGSSTDTKVIAAQRDSIVKQTSGVNASVKLFTSKQSYASTLKSVEALVSKNQGKVHMLNERQTLAYIKDSAKTAKVAATFDYLTDSLKKTASTVNSRVKAYDKDFAKKPAWFKDLRKRLNAVGGSHIPIETFNGTCGKAKGKTGCAWGTYDKHNGKIAFAAGAAKYDAKTKNWLVTHELAHMYQFANWTKMTKSATYKKVFKSDVERAANCMAQVRGYAYPQKSYKPCGNKTGELFAKELWKNTVKR